MLFWIVVGLAGLLAVSGYIPTVRAARADVRGLRSSTATRVAAEPTETEELVLEPVG